MKRLLERCAALDVHKKQVTVCVRLLAPDGEIEECERAAQPWYDDAARPRRREVPGRPRGVRSATPGLRRHEVVVDHVQRDQGEAGQEDEGRATPPPRRVSSGADGGGGPRVGWRSAALAAYS